MGGCVAGVEGVAGSVLSEGALDTAPLLLVICGRLVVGSTVFVVGLFCMLLGSVGGLLLECLVSVAFSVLAIFVWEKEECGRWAVSRVLLLGGSNSSRMGR